jgi:hypothetical protein
VSFFWVTEVVFGGMYSSFMELLNQVFGRREGEMWSDVGFCRFALLLMFEWCLEIGIGLSEICLSVICFSVYRVYLQSL